MKPGPVFRPGFACLTLLPSLLLSACGEGRGSDAAVPGDRCELRGEPLELSEELGRSSGVLLSREHPGLVWSHNDSGNPPALYAVDTLGGLVGRLSVPEARNRDWEDISYGPCPEGQACIYIADIGDNQEEREEVLLYQIPEPDPLDESTAAPVRFPFRYPDGPRDAEALFLTADGSAWVISKGRSDRVAVYRYPAPLRAEETVTLEWVQDLTPDVPARDFRVTAASITPDGRRVAVRTYQSLQFYALEADTLRPILPGRGLDLVGLREPQGEALDLDDDGYMVLTSEQTLPGMPAPMHFLDCALP